MTTGWEAARQRLIDNGYMPKEAGNEPSNNVSGLITSIDTDHIIIDTHPQNLLADPKLKERTIFIQKDTLINIKTVNDGSSKEISLEDLEAV